MSGGLTLELVAMDLRIAVNAVGEIVGKTSTEDLLDSIFGEVLRSEMPFSGRVECRQAMVSR